MMEYNDSQKYLSQDPELTAIFNIFMELTSAAQVNSNRNFNHFTTGVDFKRKLRFLINTMGRQTSRFVSFATVRTVDTD